MDFPICSVILSPISHKFLPTDFFEASSSNTNCCNGFFLFDHGINQILTHFHHPSWVFSALSVFCSPFDFFFLLFYILIMQILETHYDLVLQPANELYS